MDFIQVVDNLNSVYQTEKMSDQGLCFVYMHTQEDYIYFGKDTCLFASDCDIDIETIEELFSHCKKEYKRYVGLLKESIKRGRK